MPTQRPTGPARLTGYTPLASTIAGLLLGFNMLGQAVALSGIVFAGALTVGITLSTTLLVACCIVATSALMLVRNMPQITVGALQNVPIAGLLPVAYLLADSSIGSSGLSPAPPGTAFGLLSPDAALFLPSSQAAVATMLAILGTAAITTGAVMLVLSALDLGRIVRLMPHPVASGFLASAGMILILAGLGHAGAAPQPGLTGLLSIPSSEFKSVGLALGLAVVILILARWRVDLGPVLGIALAMGGFYGVLAWQGLSPQDARDLGYLPGLIQPADAVHWSPDLLEHIQWRIVWASAPLILVAAMIGVLGTMLNFAGIELALRSDIDTRRALSATGLSNVGLGLLGGSISYVSSANTVAADALGARGPMARWIVIATLLVGLIYAPQIVALTPTFVATGLLIYIGVSILVRWLLAQRRHQTTADWSVAAAIVVFTTLFGILPAIGFGIVAASLIFAVSYARLPIVTSLRTLNGRRSTVDRGPAQSEILDTEADKVLTLTLRGFLFFGSVEQLLDHVRAAFARPNKPDTIILDFQRVSAMDSAALAALQKLAYLAERGQTTIVITQTRPAVTAALARIEATLGAQGQVVFTDTTDSALEAAEERILTRHPLHGTEEGARGALVSALEDEAVADRLLALMQCETLAKGTTLITYGETARDIFVVDQGRLAVMTHLPDGRTLRVRSLRPGAIVGEIASYAGLPRTADVVAETPATVYRFAPKTLESALAHDPALAAAWHKMIAITLSEKIHRTTLMLQESM